MGGRAPMARVRPNAKKSPGGLVLREQGKPTPAARGRIPATAAEPAADDGDTPAV